jgi:hypothetical protein
MPKGKAADTPKAVAKMAPMKVDLTLLLVKRRSSLVFKGGLWLQMMGKGQLHSQHVTERRKR